MSLLLESDAGSMSKRAMVWSFLKTDGNTKMKQSRIDLTLTPGKRLLEALTISILLSATSSLVADEETRFGVFAGSGATEKFFQWEQWTGDGDAAVGERLFAETWGDFSGKDPNSTLTVTLAAWEAALRENTGNIKQSDLLMEFVFPLFPEKSSSDELRYEEIEGRWAEGSEGTFNNHFRALA